MYLCEMRSLFIYFSTTFIYIIININPSRENIVIRIPAKFNYVYVSMGHKYRDNSCRQNN